jgi:hypothetical protein
MTLKEEAKALGIKGYHLMKEDTLQRAVDITRNSEPPEEVIFVKVTEAPPDVFVKRNSKRIRDVQFQADKIRKCLGMDSRKYVEFVSMYRDFIPLEYKKAKPFIDRIL